MPIFITADVRRALALADRVVLFFPPVGENLSHIFLHNDVYQKNLRQMKYLDFEFDLIITIPLIDNFVTTRIIIRLVFVGDTHIRCTVFQYDLSKRRESGLLLFDN